MLPRLMGPRAPKAVLDRRRLNDSTAALRWAWLGHFVATAVIDWAAWLHEASSDPNCAPLSGLGSPKRPTSGRTRIHHANDSWPWARPLHERVHRACLLLGGS